MEDVDISPPFWQPPAAVTLARRRHHRQPLSPLLNSSLVIILLPSFTLLFIVFVFIPWISRHISHYNKPPIPIDTTPQIHKSISIRKSWDSLNIVLVIFAILCGIFAKRKDDGSSVSETDEVLNNPISNNNNHQHQHQHQHQHRLRNEQPSTISTSIDDNPSVLLLHRSKSSIPHWFEYTQSQGITPPMNNSPCTASTGMSRLRRTVSSDPYMRYQNTGTSQFRFFDDLDISKFYPKEEDEQPPRFADVADEVKEIPVDSFVMETQDQLPSPTLSPPKTPPRDPPPPPPTPPPPPPPPPPAKQRRTFQTVPRREEEPSSPPPPVMEKRRSRRRMKATKEIATAIVSLYSNRKRKRRLKPRRNFDDESSENQSHFIPPPSPPPPPPPPPLPPTVFHSWFKKGTKSKKIHSLSSIPTGKPPLPRKKDAGNVNGSESPMNGIPPPPPTSPFKVTGMKFPVVGGGYMRVEGQKSWRCETEGEDDATSTTSNGGDVGERVTCPSPDVNTKADTFIARQQDGWRLEKLNSWREKHKNMTGNGW